MTSARTAWPDRCLDELLGRTVTDITRTVGGRRAAFAWTGAIECLVLGYVAGLAGIERCVLAITELEVPGYLRWVTDRMAEGLTVLTTSQDLPWLARHPQMLFPRDPVHLAHWQRLVQGRAQQRPRALARAGQHHLPLPGLRRGLGDRPGHPPRRRTPTAPGCPLARPHRTVLKLMCGIFAWATQATTVVPDQRLLKLAALGAAARGPHAHGWTVPGQPTHRALGSLDPAALPRPCLRLLGHARLATVGQPRDLTAVQPIQIDGHHLAHNGNATTAHHEHPQEPSDSAALARIYATHRLHGHPPSAALTYTMTRIDSPWALAVLDANGTLLVSRHGLPLHMLRTTSHGLYLSSQPLPGSIPIPEHYTRQLAGPTNHTEASPL